MSEPGHPDGRERTVTPIRWRTSIVARTTVQLIGLSVVIGLIVVFLSAWVLERHEHERLVDNLGELIAAIERTASVAAFANDPQLAAEVAGGLLHTQAVLSVRIYSGNDLLAEAGESPAMDRLPSLDSISRPLHSPFASEEIIGHIEIEPARQKIRDEAARYAYLVAALLAALAVAMASAVAWVVYRTVTRPIKGVADGLHALDIQHGAQMAPPAGGEHNEIGRLVRDVNALVRRMDAALVAERALREEREQSERRFRMIFENSETGIFVLDANGYLQSWNPAMARIVGVDRFQGAGMPPRLDLLLGIPAHEAAALASQARRQKMARSEDFRLSDLSGGQERWVNVVLNALGEGPMYGVANDISERKRAIANVLSMAERDPLTGLFNRRGLQRIAGRVLHAADEQRKVAVLLVDLDGFKAVNDTHGHETGDKLLVRISQSIESLVRKSDFVARLGGDEFAVVLTGLANAEAASQIAGKIVAACAEAVPIGEVVVRVGASVGIAVASNPDEPFDALLNGADQAMYQAKRAGKSAFRIRGEG